MEIGHLVPVLFGFLLLSWSHSLEQEDLVDSLQEVFWMRHLEGEPVQSGLQIHEILLRKVQVVLQNLLECQLLHEDQQQQRGLILGLHFVAPHEGIVQDVGLQHSELLDAHAGPRKILKEVPHFVLDGRHLVPVLDPQLLFIEVVDGVELNAFSEEPHQNEHDPLEGEVDGVVGDGLVDGLPLDDLDEGVEEEGELVEERVAELDAFVEEFDIFAELARQQLHVHLSLECGVPGLLDVREPLLAHLARPEQLPGRQVREHVLGEQSRRHAPQVGGQVVRYGVLIFYCHHVVLAHLELYEPFARIVLQAVLKCERRQVGDIGQAGENSKHLSLV